MEMRKLLLLSLIVLIVSVLVYQVQEVANLARADIYPTPQTYWEKTYGGANSDSAGCLIHLGDGGYVLAGQTSSLSAETWISKAWVVKIDSRALQTLKGIEIEDNSSILSQVESRT